MSLDLTDALCQLTVSDEDIKGAKERLKRFSSYISLCFPETQKDGGLIESPLKEIPAMQEALKKRYKADIPGRLFLKMDSHLPIAGSVKARGGICYGLKRIFRDHVHVFFCEPVLFPSVLIGCASDRYENVNVSDFGLSGMSHADGLACASPSGLVTRLCRNLISGDFTVSDRKSEVVL